MSDNEEQERKEALARVFGKIGGYQKKFPTCESQKKAVFDSLNTILDAVGCYVNDSNFEFKMDGDKVFLKNVYHEDGITIDTEGTDSSYFFAYILKLVLENTKELNHVERILNPKEN